MQLRERALKKITLYAIVFFLLLFILGFLGMYFAAGDNVSVSIRVSSALVIAGGISIVFTMVFLVVKVSQVMTSPEFNTTDSTIQSDPKTPSDSIINNPPLYQNI